MCSILWNPAFVTELEGTEHKLYQPAFLRSGWLFTHAVSPANTTLRNIHAHVRGTLTVFTQR